MVYGIVKQHDGYITHIECAESVRPSKFTSLWFTPRRRSPETCRNVRGTETVLIAEDDELVH